MSGDLEKAGDLLPDMGAREALGPLGEPPEGISAPEHYCELCGAELVAEWVPFPPALQKKYGRPGEWWVPPCTPECEKERDRREWEREMRARKVSALFERSGMPSRLARCTFSAFDPSFSEAAASGMRAAIAYAASWEERRCEGRGLYVCGGVGTGKTHLVAALARTLMEERQAGVLFVTAPELLDRLRPTGALGEADERDAWASSAMNAELLVLDDLGAERASEWAKERLFVLVNHRYREDLPTVFTSNVGPKELSEHLGERVASRLIETCEFVLMDGPDHRVESRKGGG